MGRNKGEGGSEGGRVDEMIMIDDARACYVVFEKRENSFGERYLSNEYMNIK